MASILLLLEAFKTCCEGNHEVAVPMKERWKEKAKGIMGAKKRGQEWSRRDNLDCLIWSLDPQTQAWKLGEPGIWP